MAQIDFERMKKIEKQRNTIHEKVFSTYTVFFTSTGKIVQIDTYGRDARENPEKISQSIQLDVDAAQKLISILKSEFDI